MSLRCDPRTLRDRVAAAAIGLAALTLLSGCAALAPEPSPDPTTPVAAAPASPSPTPTPEAPKLLPDGSAVDNLPFFDSIAQKVWGSEHKAEGRAYVDALVAAGFDKGAMQVTQDLTTVGNPAESMQFSVLWDGECLVGQVGPDTGAAVTRVLPAMQDGAVCLLGLTRTIDW